MEKLHTSKTFLKLVSGRMHTPYPTSLDLPQTISYRNHQKSLAYFNPLTPYIMFFKGGNYLKIVLPRYIKM